MDGNPTVDAVARRIVRLEAGEPLTLDRVAVAAEQIWVRLYRELGRWIGLDGCDALLVRALDETRRSRPWLEPVRTRPRMNPHLDGIDLGLAGQTPEAAVDGIAAVLAAFIELLGAAIGLELAKRLVQNAWRDERLPVEEEKKRHDW